LVDQKVVFLKALKLRKPIPKYILCQIILACIDNIDSLFEKCKNKKSIPEWNESILNSIDIDISDYSTKSKIDLLDCVIRGKCEINKSELKYYEKWLIFMERKA
jgi:hypothetical protein